MVGYKSEDCSRCTRLRVVHRHSSVVDSLPFPSLGFLTADATELVVPTLANWVADSADSACYSMVPEESSLVEEAAYRNAHVFVGGL